MLTQPKSQQHHEQNWFHKDQIQILLEKNYLVFLFVNGIT